MNYKNLFLVFQGYISIPEWPGLWSLVVNQSNLSIFSLQMLRRTRSLTNGSNLQRNLFCARAFTMNGATVSRAAISRSQICKERSATFLEREQMNICVASIAADVKSSMEMEKWGNINDNLSEPNWPCRWQHQQLH